MQAPTETYLNDETYAALRAELVRLIGAKPHDPDTAVVAALGEIGGIWPRSVMDDTEYPA